MEERSPTDLSGGQKQRLALGATLMMNPVVLVLDEPTSQLDPIGTTEVFEAIMNLKERTEVTTIIASHKTERLAEFVDRLILIEKGEILADGSPSKVLSQLDLLKKTTVRPPSVIAVTKGSVDKLGLASMSGEGKRWLIIGLGATLAVIGFMALIDAMVKPKATEYAASLVPGGLMGWLAIGIVGVVVAYYGYQMKVEK
jgi:ABC-type multidrug transport system ATPase subunit